MLSEKILRIMRKHELPVVPGMTEKQAWDSFYALPKERPKARSSINICFTGFTASQSKELKEVAAARGWGVNSGVVKSTTHLCCGNDPGPKKVSKAQAQGVKIITYEEFHHMMETGEIL